MPKKQRGRKGEILRTGEYYDRVKDRYRARTGDGKMVHGKHLPELRRKVRQAERGVGQVHDAIRLDAYTDRWGDLQRERERRSWEHSKSLIVNHVLADIGHMQVRDIRPRHLREWLRGVNRKGKAPKTVHDIHRALSALLETAVADEIIDINPAKNKGVRDLLPELDDTQGPVYEPDEVWELTTNPLVPLDRQMIYAGCAFAGQRIGESAGRRRSNINWSAPILPELAILTQYQDQLLKSARGKARKPRFAPMHPAYNRMLTWWIDGGGYESIYDRPMPDDGFLVPDRRDTSRARTRNQLLHGHRRDCKVLGIEHKGTQALRRYFSTFTVANGANESMIDRITHNKKGSILRKHYIVDKHLWGQLCEAVQCLDVDLSRGKVIEIGGRRGV